DSARIIFPEGMDNEAQRVASLVHYQAAQNPVTLGDQLKKINIVLQNQTTIANGYVGLGPYRSEFYLTPAVNNFDQGSVAWGDGLAIHEYRHVQQFNNFNNGISKLMSVLFGQEGYALAINASIPEWFFEGDAVYNETILSKQGRGRLPLFMNAYPSLWQAGKNYSWMKLRNGSYKDYVPDHYALGYLLVNYGYEKYGLDFWAKVTKDASAFKGLIYPFQHAIEKYAGVSYQTFRKEALGYYKKISKDRQLKSPPVAEGTINQETEAANIFPVKKNVVTNYLFPYSISVDSLLYLKTSYNRRPAFYIKDVNGEHKLRVKDISNDDQFSYRNGKIVYAAYENDARWRWRDYSVIRLLDIQTGMQKSITKKSKYFSPDISASGQKIAAVEIAINGKSEIHILNAGTGHVENKIGNNEISLFTDPKFINEDSLVTAIRFKDGQMALALIDWKTGSMVRLTPPSFNVVGYPSVNNNIIFFTSTYNGSDNVFAIKMDDQKIYEITNGQLGNYFVNVSNDKITWSTFTAEGHQLQQKNNAQLTGEPVNFTDAAKQFVAYPVSNTNSIAEILSNNFSNHYFPVSKYRKGIKLFNFHSWRPYYEDPEFTFSLYGQNVLNTLETDLYYLYNQNDNTSAVGFNTVYGGWFPYFNAGTQYTFNRTQLSNNNKLRVWDQLDTRVGLSIPLSFTSGRTFKNFTVGSDYVYRNDMIKGPSKVNFANTNFSYLSHRVSFSQQVESAVQHIYPRLGYAISGRYNHIITKYDSWQFLTAASLFLPGFASSHNLVLTSAFQEKDTLNDLFGNQFSYSRGYNEPDSSRMWRVSANYHFPLLYPDWGFANILYLQRIRANAFFDFTKVYSKNKTITTDQRSVGGEMYFDTKWWNQYELTFGFRISRLLDDDFITKAKGTVFEFILPVSIFPR
ncbi:MAG: TolB family protein, partial [Chitinophagaceae bacterium]